ncbi:Ribose-5-phosphate ketol-isomerase [Komagataella phaffii GS115]|uniref:Ribose-5-phosphate isomerase n=1 Tax=Komagataella phaffii (strain GS115 / ATCC 20864) TaxID=644223 RepID=C4R763_KOMPG|nr:Ribose-5-phosphate ketol-isomerase [Komagataella phaffii GS115]CAY71438.1 Ribose-5-phosphate ketol-isomerase [Komagataella phaffii GS115]
MSEELIEKSKKLAAFAAVNENVSKSDRIIGVGSGSTVVYVAERLGQLENKEKFIYVAFDGADEIDTNLNLIKGGGAALYQEKLVASLSRKFVVVADFRKQSPERLGHFWRKGVPIEVVPNSYVKVLKDLFKLGANSATLRDAGKAKAGPVVTDNGNFVIDADFGEIPLNKVKELDEKLIRLVGVVETGFFVDYAEKAYIGNEDGSITSLSVSVPARL